MSGNKWLFVFIALIIGACSPKLRPVPQPSVKTKPEQRPITSEKPIDKPVAKPAISVAKTSVISLILPLDLAKSAAGHKYSAADLKKANMSVEYYQGFKLALDSLTGSGANYKLQIFDSKDYAAQVHSLAYNPQIRSGDLIVGPIFPDDVKAFTSVLTAARKPIISPLSPASPLTFKNQNLVTMTPPLEYHAKGAATYTVSKLKPKKIFILASGFSDEKLYTSPFKRTVDSLSKRKTPVTTTVITRGNLTPLLPQLSATEQNIFVIPSTKQAFLLVILHSLDTLSKKFPVTVVGHPSWEKFSFLKAAQLQRLHTYITSADKVNYKSGQTNVFLRSYRHAYHAEPTDFAIKGFDQGMYFGTLLAQEDNSNIKFEQDDYNGIHNSFHFIKKPGLGWINTHVDILRYENFDLKKIE
ncbi:ABC transporter substrate-binding protein [Mucilaginibacter glaciei]|uniref:Amino acid ABC transporter substrate-binding protein n=1 Tax=Mucilaginibacter glaciei TaxID=2772109 RepID=A0A926NJJ7_9SPHI|nr:ABC transporter substrate-binding protein [Mucilaginibacter glaciei]MBD1392406.1 amino acid ABC transporter substrate-binding protein [Mucilaginibacter glaciei]